MAAAFSTSIPRIPFENPTAATNLIEMLLIFVIGAALTNTFGRMIGSEARAGHCSRRWPFFISSASPPSYAAEAHGNPAFASFGVDQLPGELQAGGNMEGKEVRFGPAMSSLFATVATDSSDGAVTACSTASHRWAAGCDGEYDARRGHRRRSRFRPVRHAAVCIVAVFVAGLMIGRTPEYVGKKIAAAKSR